MGQKGVSVVVLWAGVLRLHWRSYLTLSGCLCWREKLGLRKEGQRGPGVPVEVMHPGGCISASVASAGFPTMSLPYCHQGLWPRFLARAVASWFPGFPVPQSPAWAGGMISPSWRFW